MLNKKEKSFKYVFSETDIDNFLNEPEKELPFENFITLLINTNSELARTLALGARSVTISKYTKGNKLIHSQTLKLPVSTETNFEDYLIGFSQEKPPKPVKEKTPTNNNKTEKAKKHLEHLPIQAVTIIGFTVLTVCVLGTGLTINHSINKANTQELNLSQEMLLSQLESDKRYDRVAQKMKDFDYSKQQINTMYIDNWQFRPALESDNETLDEILTKIETVKSDKQKEYLEWLKKSDLITKEQLPKIDIRLALINQDKDYLAKNKNNIDSQSLADKVINFFISEKNYDEATAILKLFPNKKLEESNTKQAKEFKTKQLEDSLNKAKQNVTDKQTALDNKNKQINDLNKQLEDIKKNKDDKDKDKHAEDKQKEINTAKDEQKNLSTELDNLKKEQEKAQKAVDNFNKK